MAFESRVMSIDADPNDRLETVNTYFRKVDARDPTVLDLFTDDAQMFFPKFGLAHGKAASSNSRKK